MGLSLRNITHKIWDQINPLDNNRTASHPAPTNNRSIVGQLTHSGLTNTVGNFAVKPVATTVVEPGRALAAFATHNNQALDASVNRYQNSIPGFIAGQAVYGGKTLQAIPGAVNDILHNRSSPAAQRGLTAFNRTVLGQMVGPAQNAINSLIPGAKEASAAAGYNTKATGAQKYIADPLLGTLGSVGLTKGGIGLVSKGKTGITEAVAGRKITAAMKNSPDVHGISVVDKSSPASVTKRIGVKTENTPSPTELVNRYNQHMAILSKKFGRDQNKATLAGKPGRQGILAEDSVYNDVAYQAEKQKIQQAYANGTLSKPIPIKEGKPPVTNPTVTLKEKTKIQNFEKRKDLSPQEQIQEAVLREKAGLPPVGAKELPTATPKETPPGQIPLNLPSDTGAMEAAKAPGAFSRAWQSTRGVISQFGTAGKELANRLQEHRFQSEVGQEKFLNSIPSVGKLSTEDFKDFVRVLDARSKGEPTTNVPSHIKQAVVEWNRAIPTILERARAAGVDVGDLGPNYFPRVYKDLFSSNSKMTKMAGDMVRNGKAESFEDAVRKLKFMQKDYIKSYGNLERTRALDMPGYEMTHDALTGYLARAMDRITKAEQFGANGELIDQAMGHMMKEGYDAGPGSVVDKQLKIALGDVNKNTEGYKASAGVRKFNALRSLNTAAISNASQLTNTATVAGFGRTMKAIAQRLDPISESSAIARDNAKAAGVELDHTINNLSATQLGVKGKFLKNVASPFFHTIEKFNRTVTAMVGEDYGNHLAARAAKGDEGALEALRNMGIKDNIGDKLTREQTMRVQSKLVERSQFKVDPQDLPGWMDSPMGKLASQFRTFGYKQTGFMWNEVLREAQKGNFAPLGRFVAVGVPVGSAQLAIKGAIKNQPMTGSNPASQSLQALAAVGGGGLPGSEGQNLANGMKFNDPVGAIAGTVGGPTISFANELRDGVTKGMKGDWSKLEKTGLRSVPVIGPAAAGRVFPKKDYKPTGEGKAVGGLTIEEMNNRASKEEADFKKKMKPGDYGLTQLSNGKYIYQIGNEAKTTSDLKAARMAIAKDTFKKGKDDIKIIGDKVLYKDSQGDVHTQDKALYDWNQQDSKNKLDLDRAYEAGDWNKWGKLAQQEIAALEAKKKFYNPKTEQDKIDDITLQQENLQQKAESYADKIANGKGFGAHKSGASRSSTKSAGSAYEYAVSTSTGRATASTTPKVSLRKGGSSKKASSRVASRPKVSLKKSQA